MPKNFPPSPKPRDAIFSLFSQRLRPPGIFPVNTRCWITASSAADSKIPVIIGNCVTYEVALELMEAGADGLLVGVGPGAACTTRGVLGIGVPQITATVDTAAARDYYFKRRGKYIPIITDGGMRIGGEICKAFAAGGGRRYGRLIVRARPGSARPRVSLGYGHLARQPAAGNARPGQDDRNIKGGSSSGRPGSMTDRKILWEP